MDACERVILQSSIDSVNVGVERTGDGGVGEIRLLVVGCLGC